MNIAFNEGRTEYMYRCFLLSKYEIITKKEIRTGNRGKYEPIPYLNGHMNGLMKISYICSITDTVSHVINNQLPTISPNCQLFNPLRLVKF